MFTAAENFSDEVQGQGFEDCAILVVNKLCKTYSAMITAQKTKALLKHAIQFVAPCGNAQQSNIHIVAHRCPEDDEDGADTDSEDDTYDEGPHGAQLACLV